MKHIFICLIVILIAASQMHAQNCWTDLNASNTLPTNQSIGGNGPFTVRIFAHIVNLDNGTGGVPLVDVEASLNVLSQALAPHNICISLYALDNINSDNLYNNWDPWVTPSLLEAESHVTNCINIYFLPASSSIMGGMAHNVPGIGFSIGGTYTIQQGGQPTYLTGTIAHEFGHCLYLYHTMMGSTCATSGGHCEENVARVGVCMNCDICGDYVCDTPADPCLNWGTGTINQTDCSYILTLFDDCGDQYVPDTRNLMSYTWIPCLVGFTPGQGQRMRDALVNVGSLTQTVIPDDVFIQNQVWTTNPPIGSQEILYAGPSSVTAGENVTGGTTGFVQISNFARVRFTAQDYVALEEGFEADATQTITRFIASVDDNLCSTTSQLNSARLQSSMSYKPILSNSVWLSSEATFEGYINSLQTIVSDTIINATSYKLVYKEYVHLTGITNNPYISGYDSLFFREDTLTKQLFQYRQWMGETLVFDFSMQLGDSLPSLNHSDFTLTVIDSMLTNQGYRKRLIFTKNLFPPIIWVESLGNIAMPFYNDIMYDTTYAHLLCVHENGNLVYEFQNYVPITCGLYNRLETGTEDNKDFFLYPNPNTGYFTIICNLAMYSSQKISIYDTFGNMVISKDFLISRELHFDLRNFSKGVYLLKAEGNNKTWTQKIILM